MAMMLSHEPYANKSMYTFHYIVKQYGQLPLPWRQFATSLVNFLFIIIEYHKVLKHNMTLHNIMYFDSYSL